MSTSIVFTDSIGTATLTNSKPSPGDRFTDWNPVSPRNESAVFTLVGNRESWRYAQYYGASFTLDKIPVADMDIILRLLRWLQTGGSVTVNTGDTSDRVYTAKVFPGWTIPEGPELSDKGVLWYSLALKLRNTASVDMLCNYSADDPAS